MMKQMLVLLMQNHASLPKAREIKQTKQSETIGVMISKLKSE